MGDIIVRLIQLISIAVFIFIGIVNAERHIIELTDHLVEGLQRIGALIITPLEHEARSGIITFRLSESEAADADLRERLIEAGILISVRYTSNVGGLRVSVHYYNNQDDIAALLDAIVKLTAWVHGTSSLRVGREVSASIRGRFVLTSSLIGPMTKGRGSHE